MVGCVIIPGIEFVRDQLVCYVLFSSTLFGYWESATKKKRNCIEKNRKREPTGALKMILF